MSSYGVFQYYLMASDWAWWMPPIFTRLASEPFLGRSSRVEAKYGRWQHKTHLGEVSKGVVPKVKPEKKAILTAVVS